MSRAARGRTGAIVATVTDGLGRPVAIAGLAAWLAWAAPARTHGRLAIALVSDRRMRILNRTFRGKDAVTDVLSFPPGEDEAEADRRPPARRGMRGRGAGPSTDLGNLAIALGVARRQARAEGHPLGTELRVLALHGLLHLLGYDHEIDRGRMRRLEDRLRRRAGLPAGLIARASGGRAHR